MIVSGFDLSDCFGAGSPGVSPSGLLWFRPWRMRFRAFGSAMSRLVTVEAELVLHMSLIFLS